MSVWDVFTPDAFTLQTLSSKMVDLPFVPTTLQRLGLFEEAGIPTLTALHEELAETIALAEVRPRNAPGLVVNVDKAKVYPFTVPHIPQRASIMADSVQGVRAFGSESNVQTIESVRDAKLKKGRTQIDLMIEYMRMQALQGNYIDVNGTAVSLFTLFSKSQTTVDFLLGTATTKIRGKCLNVQTSVESALGGVGYTGIHALCGATFWEKLITHPLVEQTYLNTQMAAALREGLLNTLSFGDITFERYRGSSAVSITAADAYAFPLGVEQMFLTRFAPAPYMETVNTIGLPYYAKAEAMDFDKGIEIEMQSNPLSINVRPHAVIKLTTSN